MFLTPLYSKVFVICKLNSNLHEIFTESLELVWKIVWQVLWHYLKSFKSYGEFISGDGFIWSTVYIYVSISISIYIYLSLFLINAQLFQSAQYFEVKLYITIFVKQWNTSDLTLHCVSCFISNNSDVIFIFSNNFL